jgi:hypothetical protein
MNVIMVLGPKPGLIKKVEDDSEEVAEEEDVKS